MFENAPEHSGVVPAEEWVAATDVERLARELGESCARVRAAVSARTEAGQPLDQSFAHPVQLIQFLIFPDGYHHGQLKLALKAAGMTAPADVLGPLVWDVWRERYP